MMVVLLMLVLVDVADFRRDCGISASADRNVARLMVCGCLTQSHGHATSASTGFTARWLTVLPDGRQNTVLS